MRSVSFFLTFNLVTLVSVVFSIFIIGTLSNNVESHVGEFLNEYCADSVYWLVRGVNAVPGVVRLNVSLCKPVFLANQSLIVGDSRVLLGVPVSGSGSELIINKGGVPVVRAVS